MSNQTQLADDGEDIVLLDSAATSSFFKPQDGTYSDNGKVEVDEAGTEVESAEEGKPSLRVTARAQVTLPLATHQPKNGIHIKTTIALTERLRQRLLSVGVLTGEGYEFHFAGDECTIFYPVDKKLQVIHYQEGEQRLPSKAFAAGNGPTTASGF